MPLKKRKGKPQNSSISCCRLRTENKTQVSTMKRLRLRSWLEKLLNQRSCPGLAWKNRSKKTFTIDWRHASRQDFKRNDHGQVFLLWAQYTGKTNTTHTVSKSNFRNALRSLKDCIELTETSNTRGEQAKRTYQFIEKDHNLYGVKKSLQRKVQVKEEAPTRSLGDEVLDNNHWEASQCDDTPTTTTNHQIEKAKESSKETLQQLDTNTYVGETFDHNVPFAKIEESEESPSPVVNLIEVREIGPNIIEVELLKPIATFSQETAVRSDVKEGTGGDLLPNFAALGVPEGGLATELTSRKFMCGSSLKIMPQPESTETVPCLNAETMIKTTEQEMRDGVVEIHEDPPDRTDTRATSLLFRDNQLAEAHPKYPSSKIVWTPNDCLVNEQPDVAEITGDNHMLHPHCMETCNIEYDGIMFDEVVANALHTAFTTDSDPNMGGPENGTDDMELQFPFSQHTNQSEDIFSLSQM